MEVARPNSNVHSRTGHMMMVMMMMRKVDTDNEILAVNCSVSLSALTCWLGVWKAIRPF